MTEVQFKTIIFGIAAQKEFRNSYDCLSLCMLYFGYNQYDKFLEQFFNIKCYLFGCKY